MPWLQYCCMDRPTGIPAIRCDFLDSENCLRVYYTIGSEAPTHAEIAGQLIIAVTLSKQFPFGPIQLLEVEIWVVSPTWSIYIPEPKQQESQ